MKIHQQLKAARLSAKLSASQLGLIIGTDRRNIYGYESGKAPFDGMSIKLLQRWATATKTDIIVRCLE